MELVSMEPQPVGDSTCVVVRPLPRWSATAFIRELGEILGPQELILADASANNQVATLVFRDIVSVIWDLQLAGRLDDFRELLAEAVKAK